jgi:hypothetical protein
MPVSRKVIRSSVLRRLGLGQAPGNPDGDQRAIAGQAKENRRPRGDEQYELADRGRKNRGGEKYHEAERVDLRHAPPGIAIPHDGDGKHLRARGAHALRHARSEQPAETGRCRCRATANDVEAECAKQNPTAAETVRGDAIE